MGSLRSSLGGLSFSVGMARQVGIREVAEAAGVSITTVSHAMNGKGRLPEATRARVQHVARRLSYRPSSAARNLVTGRSGLIGISLAQSEGHPVAMSDFAYFMQLVGAGTAAAVRRGYALALSSNVGGGDSPLEHIPLDGGIVIDPVRGDPDVERLRSVGAPVVTIGRVPGEAGGRWVDNDHPKAMLRLLRHVASGGARRVALVGIPLTTTYAVDTTDAYKLWCSRNESEPQIECATGVHGGGGLCGCLQATPDAAAPGRDLCPSGPTSTRSPSRGKDARY